MWQKVRLGSFLLALLVGLSIPSISLGADDGTITIKSPEPGAVIQGDTVTVIWDQNKAGMADHVHLIIDGRRQLPVLTASQKSVKLSLGEHEITVQAATKDHKLLEPKASVTFRLE